MSSRLNRALILVLLFFVGGLAAGAQEPLTLRQAINEAMGQNPEAAIARADSQEAKSAADMARTQLLPQLGFTEDISRGNDPVYAFGTRLRQRQFTQADFALNALNFPQPIGNFSTRFSGQWVAFDSFKTQKEIHRADLFKQSATSSSKAVDQQVVFRVVEAYQQELYAQRAVDVAQHEQDTASALLSLGRRACEGRPGGGIGSDVGPGECGRAQGRVDCGPGRSGTGMGILAGSDGRARSEGERAQAN